MTIPAIDTLCGEVEEAVQALSVVKAKKPLNEVKARSLKKQLAVAWFVLRKTREPEEFLSPVHPGSAL